MPTETSESAAAAKASAAHISITNLNELASTTSAAEGSKAPESEAAPEVCQTPVSSAENLAAFSPARLDPTGFPQQPRSGSSMIPATKENLKHLLTENGIRPRSNVILKRMEYHGPGGEQLGYTDVTSLANLNGLQNAYLPDFLREFADQDPVNPIADWIDSRPWDGKGRLFDMCETIHEGADYPPELKATLITKWLRSAAAAAILEGTFRARGVLTLQGGQGLGKTSWIASLMPENVRGEYILLDHHHTGSKDSIMLAMSSWIVELGELETSFGRGIGRLKGLITNSEDRLRLPYERSPVSFPRRTVFAATVNDANFLIDKTGNSRWWTVPCERLDYSHDIDMQQVFAELAVGVRKGREWWLTPEEEKLLAEQNRLHLSVSPVEERIVEMVNVEASKAGEGSFKTASGLLRDLGYRVPSNPQARECGAVLRELLGEPKRVQGSTCWRIELKSFTAIEEDNF